MRFIRRGRLGVLVACVCVLAAAQPQQQKQAPPQQKKPSPFETVPQAPEQPKPPEPQQAKPQLEAPKPAEEAPKPAGAPDVIEAIEFRGARRVPQDTLRAMIFTRRGDRFDEDALRRDFMVLWNSGRFDDIRLETEPGSTGLIVRFVVVERQVVRSIKYEGMKSVTVSEVLDRFKERRVGLSVESQYDPNRVQRAVTVLRDFLAERGRQFAAVEPDVRRIPPSSLEITFKVKEGPKVKVGTIEIEGNKVFSDRAVIRAMKNLRPIGVPYSILLENIFAKSYDITKLEEDKDRVRDWYQQRGYFQARALEHKVTMRDVGGGKFRVPLFYMNKPGKRADLTVPVEEGLLYKVNAFNLVGVKLFRAASDRLTRELFQMGPGDVFSTAKFRKGMENMRKLYGEFGYIDFVPEPDFQFPGGDKIDVIINADEGKQFFVRRIDFTGNTTTRDKVIRRELLIDEGDIFNTRLWDVSILRLNQLGYFEQLKENEAADIKRDTRSSTVDITLKVKERGKNSVGLTGGVSGIAGSFIGFNYATNNFLGLGETLSIDSQMGDRLRNVTFGFTEPYFLDRPITLGFTVFTQRFSFDQGREVSLFSGRNLIPFFESLGRDNLLNYVSNGKGFTVFTSYPLRRSFARIGLTYGFSDSRYTTLSTAARTYFDYINFQGLGGPNSLTGIRTSQISPSYIYNTVDHPITPTRGRSIALTMGFAGSVLGGNTNMLTPSLDFKWFRQSPLKKGHVIGTHLQGAFVSGYGGKVAPPFNRWYIGGEQDVRGFEIWGISPIAFIPSEATIDVKNDDGSARQQKVIVDGAEQFVPVRQRVPIYQTIFPGGDTQLIGNFEYRIPIVGPVTLAGFFDAGLNKILRPGQLTLNPDRLKELNGFFPQAGFDGRAKIAEGTQQVRTSTGVELQVLLPVVNAPFRLYWAYNPTIVRRFVQPPIVADRSFFPNQRTFIDAIQGTLTTPGIGQPLPLIERRSTFRFTIGRTF